MSDTETHASIGHAPAPDAGEPTFLGLNPGGWVALAMLLVFAIMIWKKVPAAIGKALDSKIALIRDQLAEAESLRKEAEALKAEFQAKAASADKDREALLERARHEADDIVAKAKTDAEGSYSFKTVKNAGEYRLGVDAPGFISIEPYVSNDPGVQDLGTPCAGESTAAKVMHFSV